MRTAAKCTIVVALATAAGEVVLASALAPGWFGGQAPPFYLVFLAGAPVFLALLAWRRREHSRRSQLLCCVAITLAVLGPGVLLIDYARSRRDAAPPGALVHPLLVPLAQWLFVLAVWIVLVVQERREKRSASAAKSTG